MSARVLVVEDSPTQAEALRALLEASGYDVHVAHSGEEALELLQAEAVDLVVSDVMMPGIDGFTLCRTIKERITAADCPAIVLLTSQNDPGDVVRGLAAGADNYITKPYERQPLLDRIANVLRNRAQPAHDDDDGGATVQFLGETFQITAQRAQILSFMLAMFEDLVRANRALDESRRAAEAATKARDDVVATVSHDLRNPLGTIYTSAAMMLEIPLDEDTRRKQIAIIHRTASRMMRLLEDLLDVSRIEAGAFALTRVSQPIGPIIREAIEMLLPIATDKGLTVRDEIDDDRVVVAADRNRVLQALSNLTGNASKFTPSGGTVTVRTRTRPHDVVISVADTGPGIPGEHLPHIFDRFYQAGAKNRSGAGLGLAIVRGIAEAHGGEVWAESRLGEGTTFSFSIPLASVEELVV